MGKIKNCIVSMLSNMTCISYSSCAVTTRLEKHHLAASQRRKKLTKGRHDVLKFYAVAYSAHVPPPLTYIVFCAKVFNI